MASDSKSNLGSRSTPLGSRSTSSNFGGSSQPSNLGGKITVVPGKGPGIKKRSNVNLVKVLGAALLVIIILVGAFLLLSGSGTTVVTTNKTLALNAGAAANFQIGTNKTPYAIYLSNSSNGSVVLMLAKTPILLSPAYKFELQNGGIANISTNNTQNANLQVKLVTSTKSGATVLLTVIPPDFGVKTSSGVRLINGSSAGTGTTTTTTPPPTCTAPQVLNTTTNTCYTPKTTNTTTTPPPKTNTTTKNTSTGLTVQQEMQIANGTEYGQLMANLKALYIADRGCNENTYNNTYVSVFYTEPTGPETYANASAVTPTDVTFTVKNGKGTNYEVIYTGVGLQSSLATLMTLGLNSAASNPVVNVTFSGLFSGASYSDIDSGYQTQVSRGGVCTAYVP